MPVVPFRWTGFRGINRLLAKSKLPVGDLWDAKGVIALRRGRLRSIWEGTGIGTYLENKLKFKALNTTGSQWRGSPQYLELFRAVDRPIASSYYAAGFDGNAEYAYRTNTQQTYSGLTINSGDTSVTITSIAAPIPWLSRVEITDDNGAIWEHTAFSAHPYTTPANIVLQLDRPFTGADSTAATVKIDVGGRCWLRDLGEWLIVAPERQVARAIHKSQVDETTLNQYTTAAGDAEWTELQHVPVWLHTGWYEVGTATLSWASPDFTAGSAKFRTSGTDLHGYGATMPTTWQSYLTFAALYGRDLPKDPENALTLGFRASVSGDTTLDLTPSGTSPVVYNATASVPYRVGYPGTGMRYRYPVQYKGRLTAAEGRFFERVTGYNAGAGGTATINTTVATDPVAVAADITDQVTDGDWLVIYDTNATAANVDFDDTGVYAARVKYVRYSGGTTYLYLDVPTDFFSGAPGTTVLFHVYRPLTTEQRRRVWFAGRPADSANGIARNDRDFLWLEPTNNVVVGDDTDGDITALVPQGDDRLIVGLEAAIFEVSGDPPIDGTPPPGFSVRRLASGVGIYADTAAAWDETGQVLYFCSGTDYGLHRLAGSAVDAERFDAEIWEHPQHPRQRDTGFRYVIVSDRRLWALTDEDAPILWCYDFTIGGWTWTDRSNSASGQTGANPAVDPSDPSYTGTPNYLYESGNHGGIFAPFKRTTHQRDVALVCYRATNGTYKMRTIADSAEIHTDGSLCHGVKVETGSADGDWDAVRMRAARVGVTEAIQVESGGADLDGLIVSAQAGEGSTAWTRTLDGPEITDTSGDAALYYAPGAAGRGDEAPGLSIGDGVAPTGEIAEILAYLMPHKRRRR